MACTSAAPCALAPTFSRATSATRASPSSLRAATLLKSTSFLGGKLFQSAQGLRTLRSRPASIARAQAVSTSAPETVTKEVLDKEWLKLHGKGNWADLLPIKGKNGDPGTIDPELKKTIIKYGEMAQLTYDSVDLNPWSRYRDQNRFTKEVNGEKVPGDLFGANLGVKESNFQYLTEEEGYEPVAYIYASETTPTIRKLRQKTTGQKITSDVWIGYIAYSEKKQDIVIAWRGTQQPAEWVADAELSLMSYTPYDPTGHKNPPSKGFWLTKLVYAGLAFFGAIFLGGVPAFGIAALLYGVIFYWLESEGILGVGYTFAFAAAAAIPLFKFYFEKEEAQVRDEKKKEGEEGKTGGEVGEKEQKEAAVVGKDRKEAEFGGHHKKGDTIFGFPKLDGDKIGGFVLAYACLAGAVTFLSNLATSRDQFWAFDSSIFAFFVLLPTGATAATEAWQCAGEGPQVHEGFYELYDPTGDASTTPKLLPKSGKSPRKVVHETVTQLLEKYPDTLTISVTGHSLGGALAVLSAYDIVESGCNVVRGKNIQVACFAFEAPRVGNPEFKKSFKENREKGLAAIRVVNKPDIVTQVPKALFLQNIYYILAAVTNNDILVDIINGVEGLGYFLQLPSAWEHVAPKHELVADSREVDYLKKIDTIFSPKNIDAIANYHNLEVNLHMVSGYWSESFTRDLALCNKSADIIDERAGVAPKWIATRIITVAPSEGKPPALIEPYNDALTSKDRKADEARTIGEGPVASREGASGKCEKLIRKYLETYTKGYTPPKKNEKWESVMQKWESLKQNLESLKSKLKIGDDD